MTCEGPLKLILRWSFFPLNDFYRKRILVNGEIVEKGFIVAQGKQRELREFWVLEARK